MNWTNRSSSDKFDDVSPPYYKFGFTISKEIITLQPYVGYYWNNRFEYERESERNDLEIICFGIAIPYKDDCIIPECNYYKSSSGGFSIYSIGIGLRVSINKPSNKDGQKNENKK